MRATITTWGVLKYTAAKGAAIQMMVARNKPIRTETVQAVS